MLPNSQVSSKTLNAREKAGLAIAADRLGISFEEAQNLQNSLRREIADALNISISAAVPSVEPAGRELDMLFVIDKNNLPEIQKI